MTKSLAKGAELTPETFADFVACLKYWNDGEGVNDHCTRDPVFLVEKRVHVFGIDMNYTEEYAIYDQEGDRYWLSVDKFVAEMIDGNPAFMADMDRRASEFSDCPFNECSLQDKLDLIDDLDWLTVTGHDERWDFVGAHLTQEAAQAFIDRKGHDYRAGLRIMVDSSCYGWEFNTIIRALIDGRLVLSEPEATG